MQTEPFFTDGRSGIARGVVSCLNITGIGTTYMQYGYLGDSIDREAVEKEHTDPDGSPLGSDTYQGFEKGSINVQLVRANDTLARPGHIILLQIGNGDEYFVAGKFGRARTRGEVVKGALAVKKAYNPIVTSCLSEAYGQRKTYTQAAGALTTVTTQAVVNTRSGATLVWSMAAHPGSAAVPGWLSINSSSGALSGTAVAGEWEIDIIVTDSVAGEEDRIGFGVLKLIIT